MNEASMGALWWQEHHKEYEFQEDEHAGKKEYAGKMIAVTSSGIIGSADSLEELIEKMRVLGHEPKRDYYPAFCYDEESILYAESDEED